MTEEATTKREQIRLAAEQDLEVFIRLVHPQRLLGLIHREVIRWWTRDDAKSHQLLLLPRDHMKSALIAYRVAWTIVKNPSVRILYLSSTGTLATKQLGFIKQILMSKKVKQYWPELIDESIPHKWNETEIEVTHPQRTAEAVRDPTVFTAGLNTVTTGLHFDILVKDDVVAPDNAYTEEGRRKVATQCSLMASILATEGLEWVVGTRYHPKDHYNSLMDMMVDIFDDIGNIVDQEPLYEIFERQVEDVGDGTGEFLWPRQQRYDGKWFGFDREILAKKRAQYEDQLQYRAQYYNNPNDPDNAPYDRTKFQYYDMKYIKRVDGKWYFKGERLNIFAAMDFAYTIGKKSDFSCIVVIGVDHQRNYYVLDIDRFKTDRITDYYTHLLAMFVKWDFRKIRCEATAAQSVIIEDIKENHIRPNGLALSIDAFKPSRHQGTKEERVNAVLQPKYENLHIWHSISGNTQLLEEELLSAKPAHDDIKDALASAIEVSIPPSTSTFAGSSRAQKVREKFFKINRFGGNF